MSTPFINQGRCCECGQAIEQWAISGTGIHHQVEDHLIRVLCLCCYELDDSLSFPRLLRQGANGKWRVILSENVREVLIRFPIETHWVSTSDLEVVS